MRQIFLGRTWFLSRNDLHLENVSIFLPIWSCWSSLRPLKRTNGQTYKQTDGLTNKWKNGDKELSLDKITWRKIQSRPNFLAQPRYELVSVAPRIARSPLSKPLIQTYYEMTNA